MQKQAANATALSKKVHIGDADLPFLALRRKGEGMATHSPGTVAVIFIAQRTLDDDAGYRTAAAAMDALAAKQPGYVGMDSVRGADGLGITVSYWTDDASAKAWRDQPEHAAIRDQGRGRWYAHYDLHVTSVTRSYDWVKPA